jgi:hypothetical protein
MPCVEQKKGRYVSTKRKSPPFSAGDCKGQTKKGLDGKMWVSVKVNRKDNKVMYRWKKVASAAPKKSRITKTKTDKDIFREEYMKRKKKLSEAEKKIKDIKSKREEVENSLNEFEAHMKKTGTSPSLTMKEIKDTLKKRNTLYDKIKNLQDEKESKEALARNLKSGMEEMEFLVSATGDLYTLAVAFRKLGIKNKRYRDDIYAYFARPMFNMKTNEMIIIEPPNRRDLFAVRCKIGEDFVDEIGAKHTFSGDKRYSNYNEYISDIKSSTLFKGLKTDMKIPHINQYDFHDEYEGDLNDYLDEEGSDIIYAMAKSMGFKYVQGFEKIERFYLN